MTIKDLKTYIKKNYKEYYNEAIFILCEFLQKDKTWIYFNEDQNIEEKSYLDLLNRFIYGEPYEYIFKKSSFWGMDFYIQKGVLIPRYDSEILLSKLIELCKKKQFKNILEIGFGSGILSIVLAKTLGLKIQACDISELALETALKNAKKHKVDHLIDFNLCDFRNLNQNYDLVFSNPPYIKNDYPLDIWVKQEPKEALFGGEKGYEILKDIIDFSLKVQATHLACEFGYDQKQILTDFLSPLTNKYMFFKDEGGYDRVFIADFTN